MLQNKNSELLTVSPTSIEVQAYATGNKVINVTADEKVMNGENVDINLVEAITFDPFTHGYYKVSGRVGEAFKDGLKLKK